MGHCFKCPIEKCNHEFAFRSNVKRQTRELHGENSYPANVEGQKQYVCQETGCGKVFRYSSKLQKHEDSHVTIDSFEAICFEPGCMQHFSNEQCLKAHVPSCHRYITCEICGTKQLKKNIKRHLHIHEAGGSSRERIKCHFHGCFHTFSGKRNLNQHVKVVHLGVRPFSCGFQGCEMRFAYKHARDDHEKSGCRVCTPGDFEVSDEQFSA